MCCLVLSSSDKTSSKSKTGLTPEFSFIISISASFAHTAAVLCCPWEPYVLTSFPFIKKLISSLCGPIDVLPDNISLLNDEKSFSSKLFSSALGLYITESSSLL